MGPGQTCPQSSSCASLVSSGTADLTHVKSNIMLPSGDLATERGTQVFGHRRTLLLPSHLMPHRVYDTNVLSPGNLYSSKSSGHRSPLW